MLFNFLGYQWFPVGYRPLPSNWIADFRRLYNFAEAGRPDLVAPVGQFNRARNIDTRLTDPLADLPPGSLGPPEPSPPRKRNLAFRNLTRGNMVKLASGQQMAALMRSQALT